ncbi:NBR1-Ig-like domain-containing protein [Leptolinea tardivitalis]|nr:NBR1-Ig-like domain-containing protein [Leptolinea tardivitalis]GAP21859.1 hypothetical protein LTAR_02076 [Leptolinea tardivitalis]
MKTIKITGTIAIIGTISGLLLSACGAAAPATPTSDPGAVYTMAAATVQAQLTQAAAANPTAVPPTNTPEPSPTTPPVPTEAPTQEVAQQPTAPFGGNALATALPTVANNLNPNLAPTRAGSAVEGFQAGDVAQFQYSIPADGTVFAPGEFFQIEVGLKNVGSVTWTTDYTLKFAYGDQMSGVTSVPLKKAVKPGEKAIFNIDQHAPGTPGKKYTTHWVLTTQSGLAVANGEVYVMIVVK